MGTFNICKDLTGKVFGLLIVQKRVDNSADEHSCWSCICQCGNYTVVQSNNLRSGGVQSCGCLVKKRMSLLNLSHGKTKTKEFKTWDSMKQRCSNPKCDNYKDYGGRGIIVCKRWLNSFENFYTDMGDARGRNYSIDRINNDGNYEPSNCKWATAKEQRANQRKRIIKN